MGAELLHADRRTDMTKLIAAFAIFLRRQLLLLLLLFFYYYYVFLCNAKYHKNGNIVLYQH